MDFGAGYLQDQVAAMCAPSQNDAVRAQGHNYKFEERLSDLRRVDFEDFTHGSRGARLSTQHIDYWEEHCRNALLPVTFQKDLSPSCPGDIETAQRLARLENIDWVLNDKSIDLATLDAAHRGGDHVFVEDFLAYWNTARDTRPHFSTFFDEISDELAAPDWADRLRDRLGLAHYSAASRAIPVALMVYPVSAVQKGLPENATALTVPTVMDSKPWEYFFPLPPCAAMAVLSAWVPATMKMPCSRKSCIFGTTIAPTIFFV